MKMADLIDKDAAYSALKHEEETHELSFTAEAFGKAARIIDQMPTVTAEPKRWIPCSERMPEYDSPVLCYIKTERDSWFDVLYWNADDDGLFETVTHEKVKPDIVSHWMPLPEPPESEQDGGAENG